MAGRIRVLDSANRTMQRLGYLKVLAALGRGSDTSSLSSLGRHLLERVTKRVRISPSLDGDIRDYVKTRLTDSTYKHLRKVILEGGNGDSPVSLEIQDVYLSDSSLPSRTGKLVEANWRRYPYLATSLELIKKGTYSALTRSLVLLALTPKEEQVAFLTLDRQNNPLRISEGQRAILLYSFMDNDAEVAVPLFQRLLDISDTFDERQAGDLLPDIFRQIVATYANRSIRPEERDRLGLLTKVANSIDKWKSRSYTGGGARQEAVTVRLEPYCDLGFLKKPDRDRFEYRTTEALATLLACYKKAPNTDQFLQERFFGTFAASFGSPVHNASDSESMEALVEAGESLKSPLGYSPITDVALLAGIRLLTQKRAILELGRATEILKVEQKQDPNSVRFTVDRMGTMANVKFLKPRASVQR